MTHPLALCDAQTVEPDDLVVFEIHYADRVGENYFAWADCQRTGWEWPAYFESKMRKPQSENEKLRLKPNLVF